PAGGLKEKAAVAQSVGWVATTVYCGPSPGWVVEVVVVVLVVDDVVELAGSCQTARACSVWRQAMAGSVVVNPMSVPTFFAPAFVRAAGVRVFGGTAGSSTRVTVLPPQTPWYE